jgi:hypothetical protein
VLDQAFYRNTRVLYGLQGLALLCRQQNMRALRPAAALHEALQAAAQQGGSPPPKVMQCVPMPAPRTAPCRYIECARRESQH